MFCSPNVLGDKLRNCEYQKRRESLHLKRSAWVTELADVPDLKSGAPRGACGFDSRPRHFLLSQIQPHCDQIVTKVL
jgi:hypothetical protein